MSKPAAKPTLVVRETVGDSKEVIRRSRSNELFFAVVGPAGAGSSRVAGALKKAAESAGYHSEVIKASDAIKQWALATGRSTSLDGLSSLQLTTKLQDWGDELRENDHAAIARRALVEIARRRAAHMGVEYIEGKKVMPDEQRRAFIVDSVRHPAEVRLLRRAYANAFALVGVVCEEEVRKGRISEKYFTKPQRRTPEAAKLVDDFIKRDADDHQKKHGQHVTDAFYDADFFLDNTSEESKEHDHDLNDHLGRLISIITHDKIIRPTISETAMHHAHSARVRSACLSRQVGAAVVGGDGTIIATGTNEVPKAGGGVYGEDFAREEDDHRCAFRTQHPFCSNNHQQNDIISELISTIPALAATPGVDAVIRKTRLGQLIEFSRAVHAEMDAIISAGRSGATTVGTRLYVTTFPCHYCARHIVSAGIYEVQYIEPYPKSLALTLHSDAIETDPKKWFPPEQLTMREEWLSAPGGAHMANSDGAGHPPRSEEPAGKVLFHPFEGVAPRLYIRAFEQIRPLKDKLTGDMHIQAPEWGDEWAPFTVAYPELEATLAQP